MNSDNVLIPAHVSGSTEFTPSNKVTPMKQHSPRSSEVGSDVKINPLPQPSDSEGVLGGVTTNISYHKERIDAEATTYSQWSTSSFFFKHSYRDVGRKKFHFCLSFCSVFMVVWSSLVINTLVERGPIIFLKLAEGDIGQYDAIIYPSKGGDDLQLDEFSNFDGHFINYTKAMEVTDAQYNFAPRKQFCGAVIGSAPKIEDSMDQEIFEQGFIRTQDGLTTLPGPAQVYGGSQKYQFSTCVMLMDTDRERDINLGALYKEDAMTEGQCWIPKFLADEMKVQEGDIVYNKMDTYQNLLALINEFNREHTFQDEIRYQFQDYRNQVLEMPCRVAVIGNATFGKFYLDM